MFSPLHVRAEQLAARLPPLLLDAERVAHTVWQGVHGRRRGGVGESFWQFRRYDSGDPAERIDWRQSARSDKLYVRVREWEAAQSAALWADASPSMDYASTPELPKKMERARLLALALVSLLLRGGERALWADMSGYLAVQGHDGLARIAATRMAAESLPPAPPASRHTHMVLLSDFLTGGDELRQRMNAYAAQGNAGVLVHVVDPLEENFALDGRVELLGAEGEKPILVPNAAALRDAYRQKFAEHVEGLKNAAASAGWAYLRHNTAGAPHETLRALFDVLAG